jgi:hypothetical protein
MMRSAPATQKNRNATSHGVRRLLDRLIRGSIETPEARRGQLLLESLEKRQMLAGDTDLLFTEGVDPLNTSVPAAEQTDTLPAVGVAE